MSIPFTLWFTGYSGAGKTTIANEMKRVYFRNVVLLDGDVMRKGLSSNLGFTDADRKENIRRAAEVARMINQSGVSVLSSFITPFEEDRVMLRKLIGETFKLCYVKCSLDTCEKRDVKGLYKKARSGEIKQFTGISSTYEIPKHFDICVNTETMTLDECMRHISDILSEDGLEYII